MLAGKLRATGTNTISWNVANAVYQGSPINFFSVYAQDTNPQGVFFKPDGLKMYVIGGTSDYVNEYDLSTAWDVTTASYLQRFSVSAQDTGPTDVFFRADGLKMYVTGTVNDDVYEYDLSTAWDVSTASYLQNFSVGFQIYTPSGVFFKPDGLKMYVLGTITTEIYQYNLSTAWDVTTASYVQSNGNITDQIPTNIFFKPDGLTVYVIGNQYNKVEVHSLSTAWNISTMGAVTSTKDVTQQDSFPTAVFFKPDGLEMYVLGSFTDMVYKYDLLNAWSPYSASFTYPTTNFFSFLAQEQVPYGIFFKPDGLKMYSMGGNGDDVNEYDLSTAWDIATASYLQNFYVGDQDTFPIDVFFRADGLKMYVIGLSGRDVNEYDLSTAWDVSTASFLQRKSVSAQETSPQGVFFKPDGLKMYVCGASGKDVNEYDLSTAWDVTTASYVQSYNASAELQNVFFKPDGRKMYLVRGVSASATVNEYALSTAWNVSTASFVQSFSANGQDPITKAVFFKPDGTVMYICGGQSDGVWAYDFV